MANTSGNDSVDSLADGARQLGENVRRFVEQQAPAHLAGMEQWEQKRTNGARNAR